MVKMTMMRENTLRNNPLSKVCVVCQSLLNGFSYVPKSVKPVP